MINLDFETRSTKDLGEVGADVYTRSAEIICLAFKIGDQVRLWAPARFLEIAGFSRAEIIVVNKNLEYLHQAIRDGELLHAWNVSFERQLWAHYCVKVLGWPPVPFDQWRCSMSRAAAVGLPQSLGRCAAALGTKAQKDDEGRRIMLEVSIPIARKHDDPNQATLWDPADLVFDETPSKIRRTFEYCKDDVRSEGEIATVLPELRPRELEAWQLDQRINDRGISIDRELCESTIAVVDAASTRSGSEMFDITKGAVERPSQDQRLLRWVNDRGFSMENMRAETVEAALSSPRWERPGLDDVRAALLLRADGAKSSVAKFRAILGRAGPDDRLRGSLRYFGAFTGRWSGQGAQPHNMPRGQKDHLDNYDLLIDLMRQRRGATVRAIYGDPTDVAKSITRAAFRATPGRRLLVWDFSQIEARTLPWLCGDDVALGPFARGEDPYKAIAAEIFEKPIDQVTDYERAIGKIAILGLGYQMGVDTFHSSLKARGIDVSRDFAEKVVKTFRGSFRKIRSFWYATEDAAIAAVKNPGAVFEVQGTDGKVAFCYRSDDIDTLRCRLPSGRLLYYFRPEVKRVSQWGDMRDKLFFVKTEKGGSRLDSTYSGKLVENINQAVARDVMLDGMLRLEKEFGAELVLTVHDELIDDAPAERSLEEGSRLLCINEPWSAGLPIGADGFECSHYRKG